MDVEWFYLEGDQQGGPVSEADLQGLLRTKLPRATLVWRDGLPDWAPAESVPELAAKAFPAARPAPTVGAPPPLPAHSPHGPPTSARPSREELRPRPKPAPAAFPPDASGGSAETFTGETGAGEPVPRTRSVVGLWAECFRFGGRFTRGEFARAYFGLLALGFVGFMALGAWQNMTGRSLDDQESLALGLFLIVLVPLSLIVQVGAAVRRLNDLGKPGIAVILFLVPCLWPFMLVYLLAAPGTLEASRPRGLRV